MNKQNCWEVKKCGREPNGAKAVELGVCVAASEIKVNGIHSGKNGTQVNEKLIKTLGEIEKSL